MLWLFGTSTSGSSRVHRQDARVINLSNFTVSPHPWEVTDPFHLKLHKVYFLVMVYDMERHTHNSHHPIILWVPFPLVTWSELSSHYLCLFWWQSRITWPHTWNMISVWRVRHTHIHNICTQLQKKHKHLSAEWTAEETCIEELAHKYNVFICFSKFSMFFTTVWLFLNWPNQNWLL